MSTRESVKTNSTVSVQHPKNYKVIVLNNDEASFDFVVFILEEAFNKSKSEAISITGYAHHNGQQIVGVYSYDIAKTRIAKADKLSYKYRQRLDFKMEE